MITETIVALLAIASVITVVQRFVYVYRHAGRVDPALRVEDIKQPAEVKHTAEIKHASLDSLAKGP